MMLMAFLLTSAINIAQFTNVKVNDVKTIRSIHTFVDTATIKIPASARLQMAGPQTTDTIQTAQQFNVGDKVVINLGYNGENQKEFEGFIRRVNFTSPVELECEGYSWQLRSKSFQKTFTSIGLRDLLKYLCEGTDIVIHDSVVNTQLGKVILQGKKSGPVTGIEVLTWLQNQMHQFVFFQFNTIYAGLEQLKSETIIKYKLGWNTIKDNDLKYHTPTDIAAKAVVTSGKKTGEFLQATAGDESGVVSILNLQEGLSQDYLQTAANELLKQSQYKGYQGKITAFLQPYSQHADYAQVDDTRYPERAGTYFIESCEVNFGRGGGRRIIGIGENIAQ